MEDRRLITVKEQNIELIEQNNKIIEQNTLIIGLLSAINDRSVKRASNSLNREIQVAEQGRQISSTRRGRKV
jgi:hypothetical protein